MAKYIVIIKNRLFMKQHCILEYKPIVLQLLLILEILKHTIVKKQRISFDRMSSVPLQSL